VDGHQELPYPKEGVGEEANATRKQQRRQVRRWRGESGEAADGTEKGDGGLVEGQGR
jgi:hypothetical protein